MCQQSINAACCQLLLVHPHKFVALRTQNKVGSINIEALCLKLLISLATLHTKQKSLSLINIQRKASVRTAMRWVSGDNRKQMSVLNIWTNCFMVGYVIVALINYSLMKLINGETCTSNIQNTPHSKSSEKPEMFLCAKRRSSELNWVPVRWSCCHDVFAWMQTRLCACVRNVWINPWLNPFVFTCSLTLICFDKGTARTKTGKQKLHARWE